MADSQGIAALLQALNTTPGIGAPKRPQNASPNFALNSVTPSAGTGATGGTTAATATSRTAKTIAVAANKPRPAPGPSQTLKSDGHSYDSKAPRGTYLNLVV